jgi:hypothetical protein
MMCCSLTFSRVETGTLLCGDFPDGLARLKTTGRRGPPTFIQPDRAQRVLDAGIAMSGGQARDAYSDLALESADSVDRRFIQMVASPPASRRGDRARPGEGETQL